MLPLLSVLVKHRWVRPLRGNISRNLGRSLRLRCCRPMMMLLVTWTGRKHWTCNWESALARRLHKKRLRRRPDSTPVPHIASQAK